MYNGPFVAVWVVVGIGLFVLPAQAWAETVTVDFNDGTTGPLVGIKSWFPDVQEKSISLVGSVVGGAFHCAVHDGLDSIGFHQPFNDFTIEAEFQNGTQWLGQNKSHFVGFGVWAPDGTHSLFAGVGYDAADTSILNNIALITDGGWGHATLSETLSVAGAATFGLKLTRVGSVFTLYVKIDGGSYVEASSVDTADFVGSGMVDFRYEDDTKANWARPSGTIPGVNIQWGLNNWYGENADYNPVIDNIILDWGEITGEGEGEGEEGEGEGEVEPSGPVTVVNECGEEPLPNFLDGAGVAAVAQVNDWAQYWGGTGGSVGGLSTHSTKVSVPATTAEFGVGYDRAFADSALWLTASPQTAYINFYIKMVSGSLLDMQLWVVTDPSFTAEAYTGWTDDIMPQLTGVTPGDWTYVSVPVAAADEGADVFDPSHVYFLVLGGAPNAADGDLSFLIDHWTISDTPEGGYIQKTGYVTTVTEGGENGMPNYSDYGPTITLGDGVGYPSSSSLQVQVAPDGDILEVGVAHGVIPPDHFQASQNSAYINFYIKILSGWPAAMQLWTTCDGGMNYTGWTDQIIPQLADPDDWAYVSIPIAAAEVGPEYFDPDHIHFIALGAAPLTTGNLTFLIDHWTITDTPQAGQLPLTWPLNAELPVAGIAGLGALAAACAAFGCMRIQRRKD